MTRTARVTLRYRPGADVLTGTVDWGEADGGDQPESVDEPDADTQLVWRDGLLHSFQLVFASARTGQGALPVPSALWPTIDTLIVTSMHALSGVDDPGARMRARGQATCELPIQALTRSAELGPAASVRSERQRAIDRRTTERLAKSLARLADVVHTLVPVDDEVEALHTDHLARLLRELSATMNLHEVAAPGATAATRVAARAGEALKPAELELLETALADLDEPAHWDHAGDSLDRLVDALDQGSR